MEENRHELNNFLRKKLNQMDDSSSNWDQPNPEIWQDTKALLRKGKAKVWYLPNKKWAIGCKFCTTRPSKLCMLSTNPCVPLTAI